jgi:phosphoribosylformimino-5-aminoimidazole carboxamide ribotide isomerase
MAIRNEKDWVKTLEQFPEHMILGMDLKKGKIAYSGWLQTADESVESLLNRMIESGLKEVLCTDISKDGTLAGPNVELYKKLKSQFPHIQLIASGGVASVADLHELSAANLDAVVVGKAYYENRITLAEMAAFNS